MNRTFAQQLSIFCTFRGRSRWCEPGARKMEHGAGPGCERPLSNGLSSELRFQGGPRATSGSRSRCGDVNRHRCKVDCFCQRCKRGRRSCATRCVRASLAAGGRRRRSGRTCPPIIYQPILSVASTCTSCPHRKSPRPPDSGGAGWSGRPSNISGRCYNPNSSW